MKKINQKIVVLFVGLACCMTLSAKEENDLRFSGYLMYDYDQYDSFFLERSEESASDSELRKARFSIKYRLNKDWDSKFQLSFKDDKVDIKDAYVKFAGWDFAKLTIGQQKEPFGLEKLMSSRNLFFIERSIVSESFAPGRTSGLKLSAKEKQVNWQLGYFRDTNGSSAKAVTGRLAWTPWKEKDNQLFHLGAAFSEREMDGEEYRINEVLEVHLGDSFVEGDEIAADTISLLGVEALWQKAGLTTMAEWQKNTVKSLDGSQFDYEGGYVSISYRLSGEGRKYKKGILKGIAAESDWELSFRASQFELMQENIKTESYTLGLNYFLNENFKFMANYTQAELMEGEMQEDGDAFSLRVQLSF